MRKKFSESASSSDVCPVLPFFFVSTSCYNYGKMQALLQIRLVQQDKIFIWGNSN